MEYKSTINVKCSEKKLEASLVKSVKALGGIALKLYGNMYAGIPDRLIIMPKGKTYFVELKSEGIAPRKLQLVRHDELRKMGHEVFVIDTDTKLKDFLKYLENEQN